MVTRNRDLAIRGPSPKFPFGVQANHSVTRIEEVDLEGLDEGCVTTAIFEGGHLPWIS